jgi:hypothetical protein
MLFTKYHKLKGVNRNIRGVKSKTLIEEKAGNFVEIDLPGPSAQKSRQKNKR